jgi:hypothetical protein
VKADNKSGAANCALIFWTTEAVEQFRRRHPRRHSQRPKLSLRTMFVAPKRKPCRAIFSDEQRGPCHYLYDDGLITLSSSGADQFARRIATSEEGVPAMFGGLVSPDLINAFATNRTKPNMNPPTTVPYITEAGTQSQPSMA